MHVQPSSAPACIDDVYNCAVESRLFLHRRLDRSAFPSFVGLTLPFIPFRMHSGQPELPLARNAVGRTGIFN